MKNPFVGVGAIVSAVCLMSGFVLFKSGACMQRRSAIPASRVLFPGTMPASTNPSDDSVPEFSTFGGSKSGAVFKPDDRPRVMAGSKSLSPIFSPTPYVPATQPTTQPGTQPERTVR